MNFRNAGLIAAGFFIASMHLPVIHAAPDPLHEVKAVVDAAVRPVMVKNHIPGMAIGLTVGNESYVFDYGVASKAPARRVTRKTIFEIGSVSKTLTATLAMYAQMQGRLSLADKTSNYLPCLRGSRFGDVSLLSLGTHTPGGLPLQLPENIHDGAQLIRYLKQWQPAYLQGKVRTYSNIGIGLLGLITAKTMHGKFSTLMEQRLFPALGMTSTYIHVPPAEMAEYAQGYTKTGAPIRMAAAELSSEAYGVKTTATDLLRFVEANMGMVKVDPMLQRAMTATHTGYFKTGSFTQDLIWEQYSYPVALKTLLDGNAAAMILDPIPVTAITPAQKPLTDVLIDKTGSTNGFGAYVAFVPVQQIGVVILANRNYPLEDRVTVAYNILTALAHFEARIHGERHK